MRTIYRDIVSALIFSRDGKLLMGMKDPAAGGVYADRWHIPGGGVHDGENILTALQREVLEEVGLNISGLDVRLVDAHGEGEAEKTLKDTGETVLCKMKFYVHEVRLPKNAADVTMRPGDDLVKLAWVDLDDIHSYPQPPPSIPLLTRLGYLPNERV